MLLFDETEHTLTERQRAERTRSPRISFAGSLMARRTDVSLRPSLGSRCFRGRLSRRHWSIRRSGSGSAYPPERGRLSTTCPRHCASPYNSCRTPIDFLESAVIPVSVRSPRRWRPAAELPARLRAEGRAVSKHMPLVVSGSASQTAGSNRRVKCLTRCSPRSTGRSSPARTRPCFGMQLARCRLRTRVRQAHHHYVDDRFSRGCRLKSLSWAPSGRQDAFSEDSSSNWPRSAAAYVGGEAQQGHRLHKATGGLRGGPRTRSKRPISPITAWVELLCAMYQRVVSQAPSGAGAEWSEAWIAGIAADLS